jgi:hypothetical protein
LLPDFEDISYLKQGSPIQQKVFALLTQSKILYHLRSYQPILTGTLPLDIFIEGKSDLDIICCSNQLKSVEKILLAEYAPEKDFFIERKTVHEQLTLICRFEQKGFPFEIFCQATESREQYAYRHMIVEYKLLQQKGPAFKDSIIGLKKRGMKTEPAFAQVLGLTGDPFEALLLLK